MAANGHHFIDGLSLPPVVYVDWLFAFATQIGLFLGLSWLQSNLLWGLELRCSLRFGPSLIWTLSIAALLLANAYCFPLSQFSRLGSHPPQRAWLLLGMGLTMIPLTGLAVNRLLVGLKRRGAWVGVVPTVALIGFLLPRSLPMIVAEQGPQSNIVVIGVDSVPPEAITNANTPNMAQWLRQSVRFSDAISPLARTYPAWVTVLTGLYPEHHGARYNLMPGNRVARQRSIVWRLNQAGYNSLYATDDRRFNPIGQDFGFQRVLGPRLGVNDILLGSFNDAPLSNLLLKLPWSQKLLPYQYLNRANHALYDPQRFDQALQQALKTQKNTAGPQFIAVHFTLPHWPYAFASSLPQDVQNEFNPNERQRLYADALHRADQQVKNLMQTLEEEGYLQNALVILLSDHGETLNQRGSRSTTASKYRGQGKEQLTQYLQALSTASLDQSSGHGSDLLSPAQYHCVLGVQRYVNQRLTNPSRSVTTRVALLDVEPTLVDFAKLSSQQPVDGISLLPQIQAAKPPPLAKRSFILESGMLPNRTITRDNAQRIGQQFFKVNPNNGQLVIKQQQLKTLDAMKLYAVLDDDWLLALYPAQEGYLPILQRLSDGLWTDDLKDAFAHQSPAPQLLLALRDFYGRPWPLLEHPTADACRKRSSSTNRRDHATT